MCLFQSERVLSCGSEYRVHCNEDRTTSIFAEEPPDPIPDSALPVRHSLKKDVNSWNSSPRGVMN